MRYRLLKTLTKNVNILQHRCGPVVTARALPVLSYMWAKMEWGGAGGGSGHKLQINEPRHDKICLGVYDQARHKMAFAATEAS